MADYVQRTDAFMGGLGIEVYRVGGSVRDELLGLRVKDADYMVRGETLSALGSRLLEPKVRRDLERFKLSSLKLRDGRQAGWRVSARGLGVIEITLPRKERNTGPGHRDFEIILDPTLPLSEDAIRRDFTFNALYKQVPDGPVADPTACGLYDLQHKIVRTTHPHSFRDDPLRTLRALRFVSVLGHDLAESTREEMTRYADAVTGLTDKGVSGTALQELCKLLMGRDCAKALRLARDTGVLAVLLPELEPMLGFEQASKYHDLTTDEHTFRALATSAHVEAPLRVRMALLFHDAGKPASAWVGDDGRKHYYASEEHGTEDHEVVSERLTVKALTRLNSDRKIKRDVAVLVRNHMVDVDGRVKGTKVRRDRVRFGDELLRDLYLHRMCDLTGKGKANKNHLGHVAACERIRAEAASGGIPATVRELEINGHDLMELGFKGRAVGAALAAILDEVVCQPTDQTRSREWQLSRAISLRREHGVHNNKK